MSYNSILVIKPSSLGDIVHTLPAVGAIRQANPKAKITWVINPEWAPLLRGNPHIDHVHIFPRGEIRGLGVPGSLLPFMKTTRRLRPDAAVDFQGLLRSALIGRLSGAPDFFGLSDAREGSRWFYNHVAAVDRCGHSVERYLKLAELVGGTVDPPLHFALPTGDPLPRFDEHPPFVLLHPFARGRGKSLSDLAIEQFCTDLTPTRVVVVGKRRRTFRPPENCVDLVNQTTLLQLVRLLRAARFVVSVDSGPMHIAAAVTDRLISIHTWSDPRQVGPYNHNAWVWKNGRLLRVSELAAAADDFRKGRAFRRPDLPQVVEVVRRELLSQNA
ncbi:MAG: glycosyltransferase family 9 protein [Chthoniobacterales bacterium]|nr:glycosyltransferase family 9 protein [Chthoniobacterales bacterium]